MKIRSGMYQLYTYLYARISYIILILQEQRKFRRSNKKLADYSKYLYKLCASSNKLKNKCTSDRSNQVKALRPRTSMVTKTRKPRRLCEAKNH